MPQVCSITRDLGQVVLFSGPAPKVHKQRLGSLNPAFDEGVSQMLVWEWRSCGLGGRWIFVMVYVFWCAKTEQLLRTPQGDRDVALT